MTTSRSDHDKVVIELSSEEALILFEFLSRFSNDKILRIDDGAERIALWNLGSILEATLVEPFRDDYRELLEKARTALRGSNSDQAG